MTPYEDHRPTMAPFLTTQDERDESYGSLSTSVSARKTRPVVPAIPRMFEKRSKKVVLEASKASKASQSAEVIHHAPRPGTPKATTNSQVTSSVPEVGSNDGESTKVETVLEQESSRGDEGEKGTKSDGEPYSPPCLRIGF